jgi:hypothetical protein
VPSERKRPPVDSPGFALYFESVVKTSKTRGEAVRRLGYRQPSMVYYHMKKLGITRPVGWSRRPDAKIQQQSLVPLVLIAENEQRAWVGALIQGEGCIQCRYVKESGSTQLQLSLSMVDPAPIFTLARYYGLQPPTKPTKNHQWKPLWRKNVSGLRALRTLREILPFLRGQKRSEAEKAIVFFSPDGYHGDHFVNEDIWPRDEFPLRSKNHGSTRSDLISRGVRDD